MYIRHRLYMRIYVFDAPQLLQLKLRILLTFQIHTWHANVSLQWCCRNNYVEIAYLQFNCRMTLPGIYIVYGIRTCRLSYQ